jgi:hypothetical protein
MWAVLAEFGLWLLFACIIAGALLWFGPFLLLRELLDRLTGSKGRVERALDLWVQEELLRLKQISATGLAAHPGHYAPQQIDIAGRSVRFTWGTQPTFNDDGIVHVLLWHELYLFNIAISPKSHGVDGFKITPEGTRIDMTPEELSQYD